MNRNGSLSAHQTGDGWPLTDAIAAVVVCNMFTSNKTIHRIWLSSCGFSGLHFYDASLIFFGNNTCLATALRILSFRNNHSIWFSRKAGRTWALLIVSVRVYNRRRDAIARVSLAVVLFTALRQASDFRPHTPHRSFLGSVLTHRCTTRRNFMFCRSIQNERPRIAKNKIILAITSCNVGEASGSCSQRSSGTRLDMQARMPRFVGNPD